MEDVATNQISIVKYSEISFQEKPDHVAVEEPLETKIAYFVNDLMIEKTIAVTMRTPGNDAELATGFLFTEGIIQNNRDIEYIEKNFWSPNEIKLKLAQGFIPFLDQIERNFYTTSSCGVCGKASIDAIITKSVYNEITDSIRLDKKLILEIATKLNPIQGNFNSTGGIHAAALFNTSGHIIKFMEDVGRHNALDKLIGWAISENMVPLTNHILLLSGRISFELVQKASMAGIRVILAFGAPSSLAIETADSFDITLIGFLKSSGFNLYTGQKRII